VAESGRINQLLDEIEAERAKGRLYRRALTAGVLLMFLLFFGNLYFKVTGFDTDTFMVSLQMQAQKTVWPTYAREMKAIGDDAVPAISGALQKEAGELLPRLSTRLQAEAEVFQKNLGEYMKTALDREFLAAAEAGKNGMKEKFPRFAEDPEAYEALMVRLQAAARLWAQGELDTTFQQHVKLLQSINETVQKLQAQASEDREETGDRSMEDVLFLMSEIFNSRVAEGG